MRLGDVMIDRGCGLGAEVPGFRIEIKRGDAVGTLHAYELYAVLDALGSVGFHLLNCSRLWAERRARWWCGEGNAIANSEVRAQPQRTAGIGLVWTGKWPSLHYARRSAGLPKAAVPTRSWTGEGARRPMVNLHPYFTRRLYFFSTSRRRSCGRAIAVWPSRPVIVSAATIAFTTASSVA